MLVVVALGALVGGCGSGGDETGTGSEEVFCDAARQLQADVADLDDVEVTSGGIDAVTEQLDKVKGDAERLANAGSDAAAGEIDDLQSAVDILGGDLDDLNADPSAEALSTVVGAIGDTVTATQALVDALSDVCA